MPAQGCCSLTPYNLNHLLPYFFHLPHLLPYLLPHLLPKLLHLLHARLISPNSSALLPPVHLVQAHLPKIVDPKRFCRGLESCTEDISHSSHSCSIRNDVLLYFASLLDKICAIGSTSVCIGKTNMTGFNPSLSIMCLKFLTV